MVSELANSYHARVWREIGPLVTGSVKDWLRQATGLIEGA